MWVFTSCGFFSAVQHEDDPDLIHVRARFQGDLERMLHLLGIEERVLETPHNDYRFRVNLSRETWTHFLAREAAGIDYTNFKARVHQVTPDLGRNSAYMSVWWAMRSQQEKQAGDGNRTLNMFGEEANHGEGRTLATFGESGAHIRQRRQSGGSD